MKKREKNAYVWALIGLNVLIATVCIFIAAIAAGLLPEIRSNLDNFSGIGLLLNSNVTSEGKSMMIALIYAGIASLTLIMALVQFSGKGFGWTFQAAGALFAILITLVLLMKSISGYMAARTIPSIELITIIFSIVIIVILVEPSVQQYFGRFEQRD